MSLLIGLEYSEQLPQIVRQELEQVTASLQSAWAAQEQGTLMPLVLGLEHEDELPTVVRDELEQLLAAIQTAFNSQNVTGVRSIQRGSINIAAGSASATASITPVNAATSVVMRVGSRGGAANAINHEVLLALTDASTVTASRIGGTAGSPTVDYEVIEYEPAVVRSCQVVTLTLTAPATTGSATLSTTLQTLAKVLVVPQGWCVTADGATPATDEGSGVTLALTTTTATITRNVADGNTQYGYGLVEFN